MYRYLTKSFTHTQISTILLHDIFDTLIKYKATKKNNVNANKLCKDYHVCEHKVGRVEMTAIFMQNCQNIIDKNGQELLIT